MEEEITATEILKRRKFSKELSALSWVAERARQAIQEFDRDEDEQLLELKHNLIKIENAIMKDGIIKEGVRGGVRWVPHAEWAPKAKMEADIRGLEQRKEALQEEVSQIENSMGEQRRVTLIIFGRRIRL